jgi:hypothetical protein
MTDLTDGPFHFIGLTQPVLLPLAVNDAFNAFPGQTLHLTESALLANDLLAAGDAGQISKVDENSEAGGNITRSGGALHYTAPPAFTGTDSFACTIRSASGRESISRVLIHVSPDSRGDVPLEQPGMVDAADGILIRATGFPDQNYRWEVWDGLGSWQTMGRSLVQPEGHLEYNDVTAKASVMRRFYRVVRE